MLRFSQIPTFLTSRYDHPTIRGERKSTTMAKGVPHSGIFLAKDDLLLAPEIHLLPFTHIHKE